MTAAGTSGQLRAAAQLTEGLPSLLLAARHLADTVQLGDHGRRRAGQGDAFWQFRTAQPGDPAHRVDWRRSARSDQAFIRDREWQAAQTVMIWVDPAASMGFRSERNLPSKGARAQLISLAAALLFLRAGERVGFVGEARPPMLGEGRLPSRLDGLTMAPAMPDHFPRRARALILTDGLSDPETYLGALEQAAQARVKGAFLQVLDPAEEHFPYTGRTLFMDMMDSPRYETQEAADLRDAYQARLKARKTLLSGACAQAGWVYHGHITHDAPAAVLMWLYRALEGGA
ncbi:DUF58 domain-containing protein [Aliiroseovarius crassostreae]|uniref:DUF58 domain-containing protein n=1 Tax=Aliiroseovarius crassostreae TaxID=154981 RepID=UPI0022001535|nr:DUF58 domain-containing protein [Aliiroseovarius crassostreae]UWP99138.1 DUF58 domain-containing protein [Aliiroseovarius crassostreae]